MDQTTKEIILFLIAVWGAALSTFNFIREQSKGWRKVRVTCGTALAVPNGRAYLHVRAVNAGHRPVTISQITLQMPDGHWFANASGDCPNTPLPATLHDGEEAQAYFAVEDVQSAMLRRYGGKGKIRPLAIDTLRHRFKAERISLDLTEKESG